MHGWLHDKNVYLIENQAAGFLGLLDLYIVCPQRSFQETRINTALKAGPETHSAESSGPSAGRKADAKVVQKFYLELHQSQCVSAEN